MAWRCSCDSMMKSAIISGSWPRETGAGDGLFTLAVSLFIANDSSLEPQATSVVAVPVGWEMAS